MSAAGQFLTGGALRSLCWLTAAAAVVVPSGVVVRANYARSLARQTSGTNPGVHASDGVLLHTEEDGTEPGEETIVFAHGFAASSQEFMFQREALSQRARVVLFDQRGHGSSGWGNHRAATIEQLGDDLGRVIDRQPKGTRIVLVAHSMGGMAALALASRRPELFGERIRAIALLSTAGGRLPSMEVPRRVGRVVARSGTAGVAAHLLWFVAPIIDRVEPFRRPWGRRWLLGRLFGGHEPPEGAADLMLKMWVRTPLSMVTAFYPALVRYNKTDSLAALRSLPVLVLSGVEDRAIPFERSCNLADDIGPNARLVLVEGAGHMVNLTHPEAVNDALCELLDRTAP